VLSSTIKIRISIFIGASTRLAVSS